jgi:hypothetical protein
MAGAEKNSAPRPNELRPAPERTPSGRRTNPTASRGLRRVSNTRLRIFCVMRNLGMVGGVHPTNGMVGAERTQRPARTNSTAGANELPPSADQAAIPRSGNSGRVNQPRHPHPQETGACRRTPGGSTLVPPPPAIRRHRCRTNRIEVLMRIHPKELCFIAMPVAEGLGNPGTLARASARGFGGPAWPPAGSAGRRRLASARLTEAVPSCNRAVCGLRLEGHREVFGPARPGLWGGGTP